MQHTSIIRVLCCIKRIVSFFFSCAKPVLIEENESILGLKSPGCCMSLSMVLNQHCHSKTSAALLALIHVCIPHLHSKLLSSSSKSLSPLPPARNGPFNATLITIVIHASEMCAAGVVLLAQCTLHTDSSN